MSCVCAFSQEQCAEIDRFWNDLQGEEVQSQISWWGSRSVHCNTGETVSLATLAHKILTLAHLDDREDIPMAERIRGIEIVRKLRECYCETDKMIQEANIITRILCRILEFFGLNGIGMNGSRRRLEDGFVVFRFGGFTPEQFEKYFQGKSPSGILFERTSYALLQAPLGTMLGDVMSCHL